MSFQTIALPQREPEVFEWEVIWPKKEAIQNNRFKEVETFVEFETVEKETDFLERFFFSPLKRFSPIRLLACFVSFLFPYEISKENKLDDSTLDHFGHLMEQKNKSVITKEELKILVNI